MAVDTRNKRASAVNTYLPFRVGGPTPDGSLANKFDRRHIAFGYAGLETTGTTIPLAHSPADVLRRVLIALSEGVDPPLTVWPIYASREPHSPDNCVTVIDTDGVQQGRYMKTGERAERHGVRIIVRATDHKVGWAKARALAVAIDEDVYDNEVTLDGTTYRVHAVSRRGNVVSEGRNVPTSQRNVFTIEGTVSLKTIS